MSVEAVYERAEVDAIGKGGNIVKKWLKRGAWAWLVVFCLMTPAWASPNLVLNGTFATGDFTDWTVIRPATYTLSWFAVETGNGPTGQNTVTMSDSYGNTDTLTQQIATTVGQTYDVSFAYDPNGDPTHDAFYVTFGGVTGFNYTGTPATSGWVNESFVLTATSTQSLLTFNGSCSGWQYATNISVVAQSLPEPGAVWMFTGALTALLGARRRKSSLVS